MSKKYNHGNVVITFCISNLYLLGWREQIVLIFFFFFQCTFVRLSVCLFFSAFLFSNVLLPRWSPTAAAGTFSNLITLLESVFPFQYSGTLNGWRAQPTRILLPSVKFCRWRAHVFTMYSRVVWLASDVWFCVQQLRTFTRRRDHEAVVREWFRSARAVCPREVLFRGIHSGQLEFCLGLMAAV